MILTVGGLAIIGFFLWVKHEDKIDVKEPEIKPEPRCDHDWETISYGDVFKNFPFGVDGSFWYLIHKANNKDVCLISSLHYAVIVQSQNRVCIKCGECDNQEAQWLKKYKAQEKAKRDTKKSNRRRKMWAKQLWKDGCKNE